MILKAHAKVNLHLDIGARRRDGYHSLKTIFQEISLHDTLRFYRNPNSIQLTVTPKGLPTNSDNLIVRALEMLRDKLRISDGLRVHLTKRIPMGAGLGGGSSDAAAALWGGWLLWKKKSSQRRPNRVPEVLFDCAKRLGADVAFFLRGGRARGSGVGEILTSLPPQPHQWMILIYPRVHVSTPLAYRLLDESPKPKHPKAPFNSFEPVILKKFPEIAKAKQALIDAGCRGVMMSGSGSTVFGFVSNRKVGNSILRRLGRHKWSLYLVHTR